MTKRRSIPAYALAALLALAALSPSIDARAQTQSCSFQDLGRTLEDTYNGLTSGDCAQAFSSGYGAAATFLLAALVELLGQVPGTQQDFCNFVFDARNWTGTALNQVDNVSAKLTEIDQRLGNALPIQDIVDTLTVIAGTLNDVISVQAPFVCACSITHSIEALFDEIGDCVKDALCFGQAVLGMDSCAAPTPKLLQSSCFLRPCSGKGNDTEPCDPHPICNPEAEPPDAPTKCTGSSCLQPTAVPGEVAACFCPPPMRLITRDLWISDPPNLCSSDVMYGGRPSWKSCQCPQGSKLAGTSGSLGLTCICDKTGLPAIANGANGNPCACPEGQELVGNRCEETCFAPKIRLASGMCCEPLRTTSCGECCPPGQVPDPTGQRCVSARVPPATSKPPPPPPPYIPPR